jgi:hypothetical protein
VNFTPVPLLLGIATILGAVALFFLDRFKPGYGRDSDRIYSVLLLVSGVILLSEWTMPLLSSLQQSIMVGVLTSLIIQNINSRTPLTNRSAARNDGWESGGYQGGARPPRPTPPAYATDGRANLRAELDMRNMGPTDPYARPRPMLGGRDEPMAPSRPPYGPDTYGDRYRDNGPRDMGPRDMGPRDMGPRDMGPRDMGPRDMGTPVSPDNRGGRPDEPPYYGPAPRPDERVRRRRPPRSRSEYNDRYRLDPGPPPPRPDYRPERD